MPSIFFREAGVGPAIIFLHGFCETHELWSEFIPPFAAFHHVLTPDLPGFGKSSLLPTPFTIDQVGDVLADWIVERKLDRPIIVGHSLGGYVALSLLERHPNLLSGLVLFHSTPLADSPERKAVRNKVIDFVSQNGVEPFIDTFVPGLFADKSSPYLEQTRRRTLATKKEALVGYAAAMRDRPDRLKTIQDTSMPVLIIGGVMDPLIPIDTLRAVAIATPKSTLFEIEKTAHMGIFEAKIECQRIISSFAGQIGRKQAL